MRSGERPRQGPRSGTGTAVAAGTATDAAADGSPARQQMASSPHCAVVLGGSAGGQFDHDAVVLYYIRDRCFGCAIVPDVLLNLVSAVLKKHVFSLTAGVLCKTE